MRPISLIGLIGLIDGHQRRFSLLEVPGLREAHASGGVGDCVGVTARGVDRSRACHLSSEEAIRTRSKRLTCGQSELVRDRRRRDGVAL